MPSKGHVPIHIGDVQYQEHEIESTQEGVGKVDILRQTLSTVVSAIEWIGSGEYRRARIKCGDDPGLRDTYSLLFHDFVYGSSIVLIHSSTNEIYT
jgi:hypothetical protein